MAQRWTFEVPVNVTATSLVNLTWAPHTFNVAKNGDFLLNLWLLRADSQDNTVVQKYAPFLLAGNQDVYNSSVLWTPTVDDIDFNVSAAGMHQLAWEHSSNNTSLNSSSTKLEAWSRGFHIISPVSSSTSSTLLSAPSSTLSSSATLASSTSFAISTTSVASTTPITSAVSQEPAQQTASPTGPSRALTIGLVIGIGILIIISLSASFWGFRKYRRAKKNSPLKLLSTPPDSPSTSNSQMSYNSPTNSLPNTMIPHEYYTPSTNPPLGATPHSMPNSTPHEYDNPPTNSPHEYYHPPTHVSPSSIPHPAPHESHISPTISTPDATPREYHAPSTNLVPVARAELHSYPVSYPIPAPARDRSMDKFLPGDVKPAELEGHGRSVEM
ncbi:uncharacterized protein Bfra_009790 [Botrytis fragariae]|uniref:Uncharacterized protein n=1 Tax=Botrytis fragariae TaxID=1964551 RepID=A0A8H6EFG1_9HELO|nr:uncharacterized protein Bfra_009790 [Botrytis fragariae]KAF5870404.1 hypothetical protein Bfra_009790 [Botrytis fragariae]